MVLQPTLAAKWHRAKFAAIAVLSVSLLVVLIFALAGSSDLRGEPKGDWITILAAKSLDNWNPTSGEPNWHLSGGMLVVDAYDQCAKQLIKLWCTPDGYLVYKSSYANLEIHAEFWVSHDANSGIFFRCSNPQIIRTDNCYEANIFDERPDQRYRTGGITLVAMPSITINAGGRWNTYDIIAQGQHLTLTLNGKKTVDIEDSQHASGFIALQASGGLIKFRKVRVKTL
jgi:hypothetical protein